MKELLAIQKELKAPKGQYNSFGKYKYRSCEDILEAVKPLLFANNCILTWSEDIINVGDRYYIKAIATISNMMTDTTVSATGIAREASNKKGMDDSQISGTTSSYARKYALNALFLIDDQKDSDNTNQDTGATQSEVKVPTEDRGKKLLTAFLSFNVKKEHLEKYMEKTLDKFIDEDFDKLLGIYTKLISGDLKKEMFLDAEKSEEKDA